MHGAIHKHGERAATTGDGETWGKKEIILRFESCRKAVEPEVDHVELKSEVIENPGMPRAVQRSVVAEGKYE